MKKLLFLSLLACGALRAAHGQQLVPQAQLKMESRAVKPVICYARPENMHTYVAPPAQFLRPTGGRPTADQARIEVVYNGFPPDAQAALQRAIDIWQSLLFSPVVIRVNANWGPQGQGVLASAGTTEVFRNIPGAPKSDVWYPIALAEKITGQNLNAPTAFDINATFNSSINWYLGLDGRPAANQYDLVTIALHELGHGLGFQASATYTDPPPATGALGSLTGSGFPYVFSTYIENGPGQRLASNRLFVSPSTALGQQLISNDLYFNSPLANAVNGNNRPRLFAPSPWDQGSSISHLDEATYPAGNPNSLMSPQVGATEVIQNPGPITLRMFDEMGWFNTAIRHAPLLDTETPQNFVVRANVVSDGTITPGSVRLFYRIDNGTDQAGATDTQLPMTVASGSSEYTATIPNPGTGRRVSYYISAGDVETGRTYTSPGVLLPTTTNNLQPRYQFFVGPDVIAPQLAHEASGFIFENQLPLRIVALAADNIGIASVAVEYTVNGTARPSFNLTRQADGITYQGNIASTAAAPIRQGDIINYRLVARDVSSNANQTVNPVTGQYQVFVVAIKAPQVTYINPFNNITPTTPPDFVGVGFSIAQPAGFNDLAIHSLHPYPDERNNLIYQFLIPIIVEADPAKATIRFDEIVLVEPGAANSEFGSADFFDYVVVEGSKDNGISWTPVANGYDASSREAWLAAYNSTVNTDQNSTAVGTPALFAPRTLNLRDKFAAGDVVRLRFRLFSDDLAHGWGWAIDNLRIQDNTVTSLATEVQKTGGLSVYPNPSEGKFTVQARFQKPTTGLQILVRNNLGQVVLRQALAGAQSELKQAIDLSSLSAGMYMVSVGTEGDAAMRKVLITK
ncbi:T9SS type A sorting domain-containing protein [Hymenobacter sp. HD11105]